MGITVKISWLKLFLALVLTVINGYYLIRLHRAEQKYEAGIEHIRYIQGEQFLLEMKFQRTSDTYTQTWAQQNRTAEMMYQLGTDMCDKRRGILKRFPNVAHQIENRVPPKQDSKGPWN